MISAVKQVKAMKRCSFLAALLGAAVFFMGAAAWGQTTGTSSSAMKISSPAFKDGAAIPKTYTADGKDVNPPLHIEGVPAGTKSLVLIVDDPDAPRGTWNHWLVWNIDPKTTEITEHSVPAGAVKGTTDFGSAKYGGPSPPSGTHRYFFKLYALDTTLKLSSSSKRAALDQELVKHKPVAEASVMGKYSR
jgi:Raf kinase inhibitor-like YbhB/YbcL family protein